MDGAGDGRWRPRERVEPRPPTRGERVESWLAARAWPGPLLFGVFLALLIGVLAYADYETQRPLPVEQARVIAVELPPNGIGCGKLGLPVQGAVRATLHVDHPPAGLPATFTYVSCYEQWPVGKAVAVLRSGPGEDDVMLGPKMTRWDDADVVTGRRPPLLSAGTPSPSAGSVGKWGQPSVALRR